MKELTAAGFNRASSVYWSHGDNVLASEMVSRPYSRDELRTLLNLSSLFSERLFLLDVCLLHNQRLRDLMIRDGYDVFLERGILVPLLRTSAESFRHLEYQNRMDGRAYVKLPPGMAETYAQFLDERSSRFMPLSQDAMNVVLPERYEASLMNPSFLRSAGLDHLADPLHDFVRRKGHLRKEKEFRRSTFFFFAEQLSSAGAFAEAARMKLLSSVIYNDALADTMKLRSAHPAVYADALVQLLQPYSGRAAPARSLTSKLEVLAHYDLTTAEIEALRPEHILHLRGLKAAKDYYAALAQVSRTTDQTAAKVAHADALDRFVHAIRIEVARIFAGRDKIQHSRERKLRLVERAGLHGGTLLSLCGFIPDLGLISGVLGISWAIGGFALGRRMGGRVNETDSAALVQLDRLRRTVNDRPELGRVSAGPAF